MAYPLTAAQKAAFLGNHEMSTRVTVFRGGVSLGDIPVSTIRVYATYGTQGGRDAVITVDKGVIDEGLLNPLSDQVVIKTGVKNVVEVPIFTGRVDTQNLASDGLVDVPLLSRGAELIRAAFEVPWAVSPPLLSNSEMLKIIQNVDPTWGVNFMAATNRQIPANLVFEEDRGQALDQIAQGASVVWQPDRAGGFTIYDNPYAIGPSLASQSVVTLQDGVNGCLVEVLQAKTREGIYNSVTVVVERVDNTAPIRTTARDTSAGSPTQWGGLFGKQNVVIKNQSPIDLAAAQILALRILRQSLSIQRSWRITVPHVPFLDPGDVFTLYYDNEVSVQVAESIAYSGDASDPTVISSRELTLAEASFL